MATTPSLELAESPKPELATPAQGTPEQLGVSRKPIPLKDKDDLVNRYPIQGNWKISGPVPDYSG